MRKNGVSRQLNEIDGGVCAPFGFLANGVFCDIAQKGEDKPDLGMVYAEKRCTTACVYTANAVKGAPVVVSKKHSEKGCAQAVVFNSGRANALAEDGEVLAESVCRLAAKELKIEGREVLIASTGAMGEKLTLQPFERGMTVLVKGLDSSNEKSLLAARALMTTDTYVKQLSYSFELGDNLCKFGAIFKGSRRVCPNMATVLGIVTTDVKISAEMLQRALSTTVKETFNLLDVDGVSSPNDMICVMANGQAGNYEISVADSEYKKFCFALREVLRQMCRKIVEDGEDFSKVLLCEVVGARSKLVSDSVAKSVVKTLRIRTGISVGKIDMDSLLCAVVDGGKPMRAEKIEISVGTERKMVTIFEDGKSIRVSEEVLRNLVKEKAVKIVVDLKDGHYTSTALGRDFVV